MSLWDRFGGAIEDRFGIDVGGESSGDRALAAQRESGREAIAHERYVYDQTRADNEPWRESGMRALSDLANPDYQRDFTMADYKEDPGYQFRLSEGQKAIDRSGAARGGSNSGAALKSLARFGQGLASEEYQNAYNRFNGDRDRRFNRLSSLAGIGQTANSQVGAAGQGYGSRVSETMLGMGNAAASKYTGDASRMNKFMDRGGELAMQGAGAFFSDERLKTNIERVSREDLADLKLALKPYKFNYKNAEHGEGDWIGVMAQDLEKTKLGRTIVVTDESGHKQIDLKKAVSLLLALFAEGLHDAD